MVAVTRSGVAKNNIFDVYQCVGGQKRCPCTWHGSCILKIDGTEDTVLFLPKIKIAIAVEDAAPEKVVQAIQQPANTVNGKIFVVELISMGRIRTGGVDNKAA